MNNKLSSLVLVLSLVVAFAFTAMGQETTGNIEVTVRDAAGAVVPNATVTIESSRTQRSNTADFVAMRRPTAKASFVSSRSRRVLTVYGRRYERFRRTVDR